MKLRLSFPSTLAMTLVCSCHSDGQHPTDAPDNVTPIGDARVFDAPVLVDAATPDAPVDGALLADAALPPDAALQPDAAAQPDAGVMLDASIDAIPDADLG